MLMSTRTAWRHTKLRDPRLMLWWHGVGDTSRAFGIPHYRLKLSGPRQWEPSEGMPGRQLVRCNHTLVNASLAGYAVRNSCLNNLATISITSPQDGTMQLP